MTAPRFVSLDTIRGFALFGVLAVNAAYFAAPVASVANPLIGPLSVADGGVWAWALPYVGFEYKSIALFSMLFGASLFLVGGDGSDPVASRRLRRRLAWLAVFGVLHGVLLWFGDILLSYALAGALVMRARNWTPRRLVAVGAGLFLLSLLVLGAVALTLARMSPAEASAFAVQGWAPPPGVIAAEVAAYRAGLGSAWMANLGAWANFQTEMLLLLTPRTAGLMMIGLALLRSGFLTGASATRTYLAALGAGTIAFAVLVWNGWDMAAQGFPFVRVQALGTMVTASLAPVVALGYAAAIVLVLRAGWAAPLTRSLAAVGRMAFTNYLTQSLVMTSLFWGGRGLGLYGQMQRPALMAVVVLLFVCQAILSVVWLRRFSHGPLEMLWRRLSRVSAEGQGEAIPGHSLAIATHRLRKDYAGRTAVAGIDLRVPRGAIYAFLGPNGAGKTTTIRMLLGLARPTAGHVEVCGHDLGASRIGAAGKIGALLDARATYDHLTGRENLEITRRMLRLPASETDRVLGLVGLHGAATRRVGQYSLGMRQRLGLARALIGGPELLILDEPMNGLDPEGMAEMRETIRALPRSAGVTVFLSSHLLDEVEQVATHVGLMRNGRLIAQGELASLLGTDAPRLFIRTGDDRRSAAALEAAGWQARPADGGIVASGGDPGEAARTIVAAGLDLRELGPRRTDLETLYLELAAQKAA